MFVGDEVLVPVSFAAAQARLSDLAAGVMLLSASSDAYDAAIAGTARVGTAGISKLVRVQACELTETIDSAGLAIRWEAIGPGTRLFPVLDADIRLAPAGEDVTLLTLAGTYRPPLGHLGEALDRAILGRIAAATIRNFINRLAASLTGEQAPAEMPATQHSSFPEAGFTA